MSIVTEDINRFNFQERTKDFLSLPLSELEKIKQELERVMQRKKSPNFDKKEKELISKIRNGGPGENFWVAFDTYVKKIEDETITIEENEAFLPYVETCQDWAIERLKLIVREFVKNNLPVGQDNCPPKKHKK